MSRVHGLAGLLGAAVRADSTRVGEVVGVFLDAGAEYVLGLEVASVGGARRFLPWVAADVDELGVRIPSPLVLVDERESYERLGARAIGDPLVLEALMVSADGAVVRRTEQVSPGPVSAVPTAGIHEA